WARHEAARHRVVRAWLSPGARTKGRRAPPCLPAPASAAMVALCPFDDALAHALVRPARQARTDAWVSATAAMGMSACTNADIAHRPAAGPEVAGFLHARPRWRTRVCIIGHHDRASGRALARARAHPGRAGLGARPVRARRGLAVRGC